MDITSFHGIKKARLRRDGRDESIAVRMTESPYPAPRCPNGAPGLPASKNSMFNLKYPPPSHLKVSNITYNPILTAWQEIQLEILDEYGAKKFFHFH